MVETQLDRIENMLKILLQANTSIELKGTNLEAIELSDTVRNYSNKKVGIS